jgi:RNA polymerase sigma-70 factor (ECF subfamily)
MRRAQEGDVDAYRTLLDDLGPALTRFLARRVADPQDLEDVYQETLLALHRARHTYRPSQPFEPWLFAIAQHVVAQHARSRSRRMYREVLMAQAPERSGETSSQLKHEVAEAVLALPASQREAFDLLQLEGLSTAVAAARTGVTAGALRVRAHRAYRTLREFLGGR